MSAWIVSNAHLDALINKALELGLVDGKSTLAELNELGQMLWRENHRSVNYRYGERTRTPQFRFHGTEKPLDGRDVLSLAHSYSYQTCEHAGWEKSQAYRWINVLVERLVQLHGADSWQGRHCWSIISLSEVSAAA